MAPKPLRSRPYVDALTVLSFTQSESSSHEQGDNRSPWPWDMGPCVLLLCFSQLYTSLQFEANSCDEASCGLLGFSLVLQAFRLFCGVRQRSGEGVMWRHCRPKLCFWRVCFFSATLRFLSVLRANLRGAEKKRALQKNPFGRPFLRVTPSPLLSRGLIWGLGTQFTIRPLQPPQWPIWHSQNTTLSMEISNFDANRYRETGEKSWLKDTKRKHWKLFQQPPPTILAKKYAPKISHKTRGRKA